MARPPPVAAELQMEPELGPEPEPPPLITAEVVADLACPFCCIGAAKLMQALGARDDLRAQLRALNLPGGAPRVEVKFVSFFLNADFEVPAEGMAFDDYMREAGKVGDIPNETNAAEAGAQLRGLAATCAPPLAMARLGTGNRVSG
jgi:hypothetical protein